MTRQCNLSKSASVNSFYHSKLTSCENYSRRLSNLSSIVPSDYSITVDGKSYNVNDLIEESKLIRYDFFLNCIILSIYRKCLCFWSSPIVFCHNDLQEGLLVFICSPMNLTLGNILQTANGLAVIDFEYAAYNHRAFDIGWCQSIN